MVNATPSPPFQPHPLPNFYYHQQRQQMPSGIVKGMTTQVCLFVTIVVATFNNIDFFSLIDCQWKLWAEECNTWRNNGNDIFPSFIDFIT
jgi:hypothetical protein